MNKELIDWVNFYEGKQDFDKSHFYTLFMKEDEKEELDLTLIFKPFECANDLIKRVNTVLNPAPISNEIDLSAHLLNYVEKDLLDKLPLFEQSELLPFLQKQILFEKDRNILIEKKNRWQNEMYVDEIEDHISENIKDSTLLVDAIREAFFGLTRNYKMVWYLLSPLIKSNYNFDYYYNVWRIGGDFAITDNGVFVAKY